MIWIKSGLFELFWRIACSMPWLGSFCCSCLMLLKTLLSWVSLSFLIDMRLGRVASLHYAQILKFTFSIVLCVVYFWRIALKSKPRFYNIPSVYAFFSNLKLFLESGFDACYKRAFYKCCWSEILFFGTFPSDLWFIALIRRRRLCLLTSIEIAFVVWNFMCIVKV